jgi:ribosomal protein S18 acetylase RimI-like enzyme
MTDLVEESGFVEDLPWDSEQFGFPVARVLRAASPLSLVEIAGSLRRRGVKLAYFNVSTSRPEPSPKALAAVGGRLVDIRVTYAKELSKADTRPNGGQPLALSADLELQDYVGDALAPDLIELSRAAGSYSRFRNDPRIDTSVFERIYDAWIERSVKREIADRLVVARQRGAIVGLVTWKGGPGFSQIGLFSVHADARRQGVGRALLRLATSRMQAAGSDEARVVTQGANIGARRLYEDAGFSVAASERCYHLWLS